MKLLQGTRLVSAAVAISLLAMGTSAADSTALPDLSTATQQSTGSTAAASTASNTGTASGSAASTGATTSAGTQTTAGVSITGGSTDTGTSTVPTITGDAASTTGGALSGLPKLSGAYTIVAASVPPTANAPYMQQSSLPEGTVFIVVGAILGFMAMSVLLWRGLVAWSLHRSVKRAALSQNMSDTKALFRAPPAPFYKYSDRDSTISLSGLGAKGGKKGGRPTTATGAPSGGSLFFSPTAGAAAGGLNSAGNRASSYLPAGYYAAGAAQAGNAQSHVSLGQGHGNAISLSNLGPQSAGYSRARSMGPSPPDSPSLTASRGPMASNSTLNLTQGYGGEQRAPSAYLEDLFDGEGGPPVPGHQSARDSRHGQF
ncbi:hypothetical protein LSUE1_G001191 [Lachnellula suecica]|uniref:CSI2 protein n=1 Tax=Lachnellula suecica TaxID=602035 RepID=A0A8T9CDH4_9HELO|nr:hypothetical protein LSUE1_G001191 [Lachnellula suecica]